MNGVSRKDEETINRKAEDSLELCGGNTRLETLTPWMLHVRRIQLAGET